MNNELAIAIVSATVALLSVALSSRTARRQSVLMAELAERQAERAIERQRQDLISHFRDPLLWAAFDLQSRLYNMAALGFRGRSLPGRQGYGLHSTLFVFAQYLGWVEILRRRIQFLDLGDRRDNRRIVNLMARIELALATNPDGDRRFTIYRHEQRALGEIMISEGGEGDSCIGYATFCRRLDHDSEFAAWFKDLTRDFETLAPDDAPAVPPRIVELQNRLMDLIDILDPDADRFPDRHRDRLASNGGPVTLPPPGAQ